ncbi:ABC transporter ATP-binding protein [Brevibacillus nitrificans]|jgi:branched-chain amino acid transport system ATP-binding protein|uniref:ABC transporter ATP-binding protein n=1 Tax=Brevibacillus nitrificans TaxID=651560 RepID=A0A3M8D2P4_9BACL|nr:MULTISPECIES: ABC transporter ATP-binding protein [Brevibacillus]MED1796821.1 ABC transporter ATP-binding protein [Brevibacillus nitrificans]MED1953189.1 ABC transporter ATP-binding protein [Brevibacillus centrosporus]RNB81465.1 ABC transporter ATP-binding protein [Brevibacillus nitrificans]
MLEVANVEAGYGKIQILNNLSLSAKENKLTLLIGPNGAGKSTLLKTIFGFVTPSKGSIRFQGEEISGLPSHQLASLGIGFLLQRVSVFPDLTIEENLKLGAWSFKKDSARVAQRIEYMYEKFPILKQKRSESAGLMSGGQKRMLEIARTLMPGPRLILVDEPSAGLSPKIAKEVYRVLHELRDEGITLLMVDQNIRESIGYSDHVYVLERGQVSSESAADEIEKNLKQVVESWLKF